MRHQIRLAALGVSLVVAGCSARSPSSPGNGAAGGETAGRVVDILSAAGISGVLPTSADHAITSTATDLFGGFTVKVTGSDSGTLSLTFAGPGIVTRQTNVKVPGDPATITVIPSTFDLSAFNEMCRSSTLPNQTAVLSRWTSPPPLVIETRTMQYADPNMNSQFTTINDTLSDGEYDELVADLNWALPRMTGGQFSAFAATTRQTDPPGTAVTMLASGQITLGRIAGLTTGTGFAGLTRWEIRSDGVVTGAMIMLDRDFDRNGNGTRRALRTHELGHALGFNHVMSIPSVMNLTPASEPNAFDLSAAKIAFLRQPGNRTPDVDPSGFSTNRLSMTWGPAIR
jgi:hypothetical protein